MADIAARDARAELVADVCVHNFVSAADATENFKALKAKSSWERDDFIENGGWAVMAGIDSAIPNAADSCADELLNLKVLPSQEVGVTDS